MQQISFKNTEQEKITQIHMEWYLAAFELHFCHFHFIGKVNNSTTPLSEDKPRTHYIFLETFSTGLSTVLRYETNSCKVAEKVDIL